MAKGDMDAEPEDAIGNPTTQIFDPDIQWGGQTRSDDSEEEDAEDSDTVEKKKKRKAKASVGKKKKLKKASKLQETLEETAPGVEADGFFDPEE
jgi:hypothetical protein